MLVPGYGNWLIANLTFPSQVSQKFFLYEMLSLFSDDVGILAFLNINLKNYLCLQNYI